MHLYGRYKIKKLKTIYDHIVIYLFAFINVKQTIKIWINYVKSILFNACSVSDDMLGSINHRRALWYSLHDNYGAAENLLPSTPVITNICGKSHFRARVHPDYFYIHKKPFIWLTLNTTFSYSSVDKQGICDVCFSFQTIGCFALRAVAE